MQQAGAGPDAVIASNFTDIIESPLLDCLTEKLAGVLAECRRSVEGDNTIAIVDECLAITAGTATSVQDKNLSVNNIHFQFNFSERHD